MKRFTVLSLAVIGLCTLSAGTTVFAGRQQPGAERLAMLRFDNCAIPCWIGIVPGKTTTEQARSIIKSIFGNSSEYALSVASTEGADLLPVILSERANPVNTTWIGLRVRSDRVIDSIVFSFADPSNPITLADVHNLFGAPSYVRLPSLADDRSGNLVLTYGSVYSGANVYTVRQSRLALSQEVFTLILYSRVLIPIMPSDDLRPWEGFRPLATYLGR